MFNLLADWPRLFLAGQEAGRRAGGARKKWDKVIFFGMGGSAIAGEIIGNLARPICSRPVFVFRDWPSPAFLNGHSLVYFLSYSGNTAETLLAWRKLKRQPWTICAVSSNGRLVQLCRARKIPLIKMPPGLPPRAALPFFLGALLAQGQKLGWLSPGSFSGKHLRRAANLAARLVALYGPGKKAGNLARLAAAKLIKTIPLIITTPDLAGVGRRWVNQFNENSKVMAHLSVLPEMLHNEIVGLTDPQAAGRYLPILLTSATGDKFLKAILRETKTLLRKHFPKTVVIRAVGKNPLEQAVSLTILGDYISTYLAGLRRVDPWPVKVIDQIKRKLPVVR